MQITVNGRVADATSGTTVAEWLRTHDLNPVRVAVEINEELVPRSVFGEHEIHSGDRIEIVTFVGGG